MKFDINGGFKDRMRCSVSLIDCVAGAQVSEQKVLS